MHALIARLDPDQAHVAAWSPGDGAMRVIAGAGSGKTTASTALISRLVSDEEVPPNALVGATFTRKAADELSQRVRAIVPAHLFGALRIGTFHSIALRRVREVQVGQWPMDRCLDLGAKTRAGDIPSTDVLWRTAVEYGTMPGSGRPSLKIKEADYREYMSAVRLLRSAGYNRAVDAPAAAIRAVAGLDRLVDAWQVVDDAKAALAAWDFQDVIAAYGAGLTSGEIPDGASVVLVDEAQDNDRVQLQIARSLAENGQGSLILVGDLRQCIHVWRGAYPALFQNAGTEIGAHDRALRYNYRSVAPIVAASNRISAGKVWSLGDACIPARETPATAAIHVISDVDVPSCIAARIREEVAAGVSPGKYAILARTNAEVGEFQGALTSAKIPCVVLGGRSLFDQREVEAVLCYAILSQRDAVQSLEKVINVPRRYLSRDFMSEVKRVRALYPNRTLADAICTAAQGAKPFVRRNAIALAQTLRQLRATPWDQVPDAIRAIVMPQTEKDKESASPDEDRPALFRAALGLIPKFQDAVSLYEFSQRCATNAMVVNEGDDVPGNRVIIATVHRAKGLEWQHVIVSATHDRFPHARALGSQVADEERLFYVATTRARDTLTLAYDRGTGPSRFIRAYFPDELAAERASWLLE